ncbi:winged helix-turn-helix transcriptional regulator [Actinacidiphila acididurans]|uniref:Helix-turn-helix transcriptional regulator n=1 Tax=Actinacidiphila acididurans TaxID=2784346 RepID=A0ABS2TX19_9ACTN|nr:helix-turn-helix domain-containing protein [Actinacidiphila acididurans]MBM9507884.1 helix-turn-helix transcriptional regulator [Actinacidiphila acididurans]
MDAQPEPARQPESARPATSRNDIEITDADCAMFQNAVELVGGKWNGAILLAIGRGATRFSEIGARIDGISSRLLAARLRLLEHHGLVVRDVIASHPVQIRYTLSQSGRELVRVLIPLVPWGSRWGITVD